MDLGGGGRPTGKGTLEEIPVWKKLRSKRLEGGAVGRKNRLEKIGGESISQDFFYVEA